MLDDNLKLKLEEIFISGNPLEPADAFFNSLNIEGQLGRFWIQGSNKAIEPYERLSQYESLLEEIQNWNSEIYSFIHKGTPFYFCGIHSFDIGSYDRAIFYFDAAFSEDVKNKPEKDAFHWENSAAYAFYRLDINYGNDIVKIPANKIKGILDPLIKEFASSLKVQFNIDFIVNKFVKTNIKDGSYRSIIPALYLFAVESERRFAQLNMRSDKGGSIEPFVVHILKGCLIFESLLKLIYPSHSSSELAMILKDPFIRQDLEYCKNPKTINKDLIDYVSGVRRTLQDIIIHMVPYLEHNAYISDLWITTTYSLRNVTAHNLVWPDRFNPDNYEKLFKSVLFSILYLILKKF